VSRQHWPSNAAVEALNGAAGGFGDAYEEGSVS
jgi:hypothetical protein